MKVKIFIIVILVIVIMGAAVSYFSYKAGYKKGYDLGKEAGITASKVQPSEAVTNPLEEMPSINPFEKVLNPFKEGYKNPFK